MDLSSSVSKMKKMINLNESCFNVPMHVDVRTHAGYEIHRISFIIKTL